MIGEIFTFIKEHRVAICAAVLVLSVSSIAAIVVYTIVAPGLARPTATPTALPAETPTALPSSAPSPTPAPSPSPAPPPSPTPVPSPTVTPDLAIERSITPLETYGMNHLVQVDRSTTTGLLSIDLYNSDTGGEYAYRNDTFVARLVLADISQEPVDYIRMHATCTNALDGSSIYEDNRTDYVLLKPGDKLARTVGFKVPSGATTGKYVLRVDVRVCSLQNASWSDFGCGYESGLSILTTA